MREEVSDEGHLRKYLLGAWTEAEQQALEERLLSESELFDLLLVVEDELMDDYLSGALSPAEGDGFDTFFLSTPERRRKLGFAMALRRYVTTEGSTGEEPGVAELASLVLPRPSPIVGHPPSWWKQAVSFPSLRLAAAALIVLGVGLGIWRVFFYRSEVDKGMAALAQAYRNERPVEARISGLGYAPLPNTRGDERAKVDDIALNRAERILLDEVAEHPRPQAHHALGQFYLTQEKFDSAIEQFEAALKDDPKNPTVHSDYGVALLEKGKADRAKEDSGASLEDFARSLEHLSKAIEMDGSLLEALFDRALLYQEMMLPMQARQDWLAYLEKDLNSKWADEARRNLKQLEERKDKSSQNRAQLFQDFLVAYQIRDPEQAWRAVNQSRARTGNLIVEKLLDAYLDLMMQGKSKEASDNLQMLSYAGEVEGQRVGDNFTSDLARGYKLTTPAQREVLAQARKSMKAASSSFNKSEFDQAVILYSKAKLLFEQANDRCEATFAASWMGNCYLRIPNTERSLSIFEPLSRTCEKKNYRWLFAQSLNGISDAQTSLDALSKALEYANRSLEVSEQIQDVGGMLRNLQQSVSMHLKFGNYRESLRYSLRAFELSRAIASEPKQMWPFYHETAFDFYWVGLPGAALEFEKEALRLAIESEWPLIISRSYTRLGLIYEKLQNYDEATRTGQLALDQGGRIESISGRLNTTANATLRLGHLYRQKGELAKAIEVYDQAIKSYEKLNFHIYQYEAHKGKLLTLISLGRVSAAKEELCTALSLFDQYRSQIWEESNRNNFFDAGQNIYDIAAGFAFSRLNDPEKAFEFSESSRARSLLDLIRTGAEVVDGKNGPTINLGSVTNPLPLSEIRRRLPDQAQILQYSVLDDGLLIWVISKTRVECTEKKIASDELSNKVLTYLDLINKPPAIEDQNASSYGKGLYDILIAPIEPFLESQKQLCIVPDKALNYLSFGALISPTSGKYLIENFKFAVSPSASIFIACSDEGRRKEGGPSEKILSVGNPSFDRSLSLPSLPSAGTEAEQVATCYGSIALTGERATEKEVTRAMMRAELVHLATHYVLDERSPLRSSLLLTKERGQQAQDCDGVLQAHEIYKMKLPRTRLVVLSACQTGIEHAYRGEGAISIARPFIAAGVPLVVASLWAVDSASTADLMIRFHRHRKQEGLSTVEALRLAQLDMLTSTDERFHHPYYWAPFTSFGGYATF